MMVDASVLQAAIAAVTAQGGAMSFGYTRDGSAFTVHFEGDGPGYTDIWRPSDPIDEVLAQVARNWSGEVKGTPS